MEPLGPQEKSSSSAELRHSWGFWTAGMAAPHFGLQLTKYLTRSIPNNFPLPPTLRFLLPIALKKRFLLLVDGQPSQAVHLRKALALGREVGRR